jgi:hypothetical protein
MSMSANGRMERRLGLTWNRAGEQAIKRTILQANVVIALLIWTSALRANAQDREDRHGRESCSNASLRGNYGFQINGSIPGVFAIGGIALVTFGGEGKFYQDRQCTGFRRRSAPGNFGPQGYR